MLSDRSYDLIVSLGDWCAPAANIRRRFGLEQAMPFDWWVTSYNGLVRLLEDRFADLFDPTSMQVLDRPHLARETVLCHRYGILHHHDFNRDGNGQISADISSEIPRAIEKFKFIVNRFFESIAGKRVLFIRSGLQSDLWFPESGLPFTTPNHQECLERGAFLHGLLRRTLAPAALDLLILIENGPTGATLPLDGGHVVFDDLGPRIDEIGFLEANYDLLLDRLGVRLASDAVAADQSAERVIASG